MIRKRYYIALIVLVLFSSLSYIGTTTLYKEWKLYNIYGPEAAARENLLWLNVRSFSEKVFGIDLLDSGEGLPVVSLNVPEQSFKNLNHDLPDNIKNWQKAYLLYPDSTVRAIKIRYRGDNPINWAYEKKSYRIKTKKKQLHDQRRKFNYVVPQDENLLNTYISYYVGESIGLLVPESRMVELVINGKSKGVYFEYSQIDESFLRLSGRMPVNLYKGEQYHTERAIDRSNDLFDNPSLWKKSAIFNQRKEKDYEDLSHFLNLLRSAETSEQSFNKLIKLADIEKWAKFAAYQTLVQSWHNDNHHNMRILSDVWSGTVEPVIHDTGSNFSDEIIFDSSPHSLLMLYNRSSHFLSLKYKYLYQFLQDKILSNMASHVDALLPKLSSTWDRDSFHTQHAVTNGHDDSSLDKMKSSWNMLIENILKKEEILNSKLTASPNLSWHQEEKTFSLVLNDVMGVKDIKIQYSGEVLPSRFVYDKDGDGIISNKDIDIPFFVDNNSIILQAEFFSNRVITKNNIDVHGLMYPDTKHVKTQFNILSDVDLNINNIISKNILNMKESVVTFREDHGVSPSKYNDPVVYSIKKPTILSGNIIINRIMTYDEPVVIKQGTEIRMVKGAGMIFNNKLLVNGTIKNPVIVKSLLKDNLWTVFALNGKSSSKSVISNLTLEGGSGYSNSSNVYTAMFSLHNVSDVKVDNLIMSGNDLFDDMIHIVYSNNIHIDGCKLSYAYSDAIDIDISSVLISNCNIENSGNDGIDLMSSDVLIKDTKITKSLDKGVSIGEGSTATIMNSELSNNKIGLEAKDGSIANILFSKLSDNEKQVNAYSKNWRYGDGGHIAIFKTIFDSNTNKIKTDKKSSIEIFDPKVIGSKLKVKKNISISSDALTSSKDILSNMLKLNHKNSWKINIYNDMPFYSNQNN